MQRALIVGAGASGFLHALALRSAGVVIARVFDPDRASAEHLAALVGGAPCSTFREALGTDAEIAAVCSPPIHHVAQATALAQSGRLVFLEKPVALTPRELEVLRACPRIVPIVQWRAGRSAHELRAALGSGVFGPRPQVRCELRLWRDSTYFQRRDRAQWGCGAMLSIGIHAIDLVLWILNRRVAGAAGTESCDRAGLDVPTTGELAIDFEGGARATIAITLDAPGPDVVHLAVEGASTSAWLTTHEHDPTAMPLSWRGVRPASPAVLGGATGSPLLVPFIHEALGLPSASCTALGLPSASCTALGLPSASCTALAVDDVAEAHRLAFALTSTAGRRDLCRRSG